MTPIKTNCSPNLNWLFLTVTESPMRSHRSQVELGCKSSSPEQSVTTHVSYWLLNSYGKAAISCAGFLFFFFFFLRHDLVLRKLLGALVLLSTPGLFSCAYLSTFERNIHIDMFSPPSSALHSRLFISNCFQHHCNRRLVITVISPRLLLALVPQSTTSRCNSPFYCLITAVEKSQWGLVRMFTLSSTT